MLEWQSEAVSSATYLVRALKLEVSGSGSYYNLSQGASVTVPAELLSQTQALVADHSELGPYTLDTPSSSGSVATTNNIPESTGRAPGPSAHVN